MSSRGRGRPPQFNKMVDTALASQYRALIASYPNEKEVKDSSIKGYVTSFKALRSQLGLKEVPTSFDWLFQHFNAVCLLLSQPSQRYAVASRRTWSTPVLNVCRFVKGRDSPEYKRVDKILRSLKAEVDSRNNEKTAEQLYAQTSSGKLPLADFREHVTSVLQPLFEAALSKTVLSATDKRNVVRFLAASAQCLQRPLEARPSADTPIPMLNLRLAPGTCKIVHQVPPLGPQHKENYLFVPRTGPIFFYINEDKVSSYKSHAPARYLVQEPLASQIRQALAVVPMQYFCSTAKDPKNLAKVYGDLVSAAFNGLKGKAPTNNDIRAAIITWYFPRWDGRQNGKAKIELLQQAMRSSEKEFRNTYRLNRPELLPDQDESQGPPAPPPPPPPPRSIPGLPTIRQRATVPTPTHPLQHLQVDEIQSQEDQEDQQDQEQDDFLADPPAHPILPPDRPSNVTQRAPGVEEGLIVRDPTSTTRVKKNAREREKYLSETFATRKRAKQYVRLWNRGITPLVSTVERYRDLIEVHPSRPLGEQYTFLE